MNREIVKKAEELHEEVCKQWGLEVQRWIKELEENLLEFAIEIAEGRQFPLPNKQLADNVKIAGELMCSLDTLAEKLEEKQT